MLDRNIAAQRNAKADSSLFEGPEPQLLICRKQNPGTRPGSPEMPFYSATLSS